MTAREAAFFTGLDLVEASEQERDIRQLEQARLRRCLAAALRREPTPRELRRALAAWEMNR